jgi:hypothetical protein
MTATKAASVAVGILFVAVMMSMLTAVFSNRTHCAIPGYSICSFARCLPTCKDDTARTSSAPMGEVPLKPWPTVPLATLDR